GQERLGPGRARGRVVGVLALVRLGRLDDRRAGGVKLGHRPGPEVGGAHGAVVGQAVGTARMLRHVAQVGVAGPTQGAQHDGGQGVASKTPAVQVAHPPMRKKITSPSWTRYSRPSTRCLPAARRALIEPASTSSSTLVTSARMNFLMKSVWMTPAAIGAGASTSQGQALTSGSPAVK